MQQDIKLKTNKGSLADVTAHYEIEEWEGEPVQHNLLHIEFEMFEIEIALTKDQLPCEVVAEIIKQIELAEGED